MEIADQSHRHSRQFHAGEYLRCHDGMQLLDGFDLDDHGIVDDQVDPIAGVEIDSLVVQGEIDLSTDFEASQLELAREASLIHGFKQPGPHEPMDLDGSSDDLSGARVVSGKIVRI
ncbi:MAG TPA: hypothetical protein VF761_13190 [Gemmatimonadaceae bacterium]